MHFNRSGGSVADLAHSFPAALGPVIAMGADPEENLGKEILSNPN
jgi:hypothetical protein